MIIFTDHALRRMKERKVLKRQVVGLLKSPDSVVIEEDKLKSFQKKFGRKVLEVIAEVNKNKIIIITLYWL
jgi:hypothetical protein